MTGVLHPAAVAATSDEARRGRSPVERLIARFPGIARRIGAAALRRTHSRPTRALVAWSARWTFAAFGRRDWELNTLFLDPETYEFLAGEPAGSAPGMRHRYEGVPGYLEGSEALLEVFDDMAVELERVGWAPDGRLAVLVRFRGRGGGSGIPVEQLTWIAVEFRDGLIVRHWYWWDVDAGYRNLGIKPPRR